MSWTAQARVLPPARVAVVFVRPRHVHAPRVAGDAAQERRVDGAKTRVGVGVGHHQRIARHGGGHIRAQRASSRARARRVGGGGRDQRHEQRDHERPSPARVPGTHAVKASTPSPRGKNVWRDPTDRHDVLVGTADETFRCSNLRRVFWSTEGALDSRVFKRSAPDPSLLADSAQILWTVTHANSL